LGPSRLPSGIRRSSDHLFCYRGIYILLLASTPLLAALGSLPVIGDVLRYTVIPLVGLAMLPATLRLMFAPCGVSERFGREFPRLMMLRPWQLRASLRDGTVMMRSAGDLRRGYSALQVPAFIAAGQEDRIVNHRQSRALHEQMRSSELQVLPTSDIWCSTLHPAT
jgi:pimeloyl-ACP methyl ester carboxylesterase